MAFCKETTRMPIIIVIINNQVTSHSRLHQCHTLSQSSCQSPPPPPPTTTTTSRVEAKAAEGGEGCRGQLSRSNGLGPCLGFARGGYRHRGLTYMTYIGFPAWPAHTSPLCTPAGDSRGGDAPTFESRAPDGGSGEGTQRGTPGRSAAPISPPKAPKFGGSRSAGGKERAPLVGVGESCAPGKRRCKVRAGGAAPPVPESGE